MERKFRLCPSWRLELKGNELMVIGGADAIFSIAEDSGSSFFSKLGEKTFSRKEVPIGDLPVFEQLLSAGIVMPSLKGKKLGQAAKSLFAFRKPACAAGGGRL